MYLCQVHPQDSAPVENLQLVVAITICSFGARLWRSSMELSRSLAGQYQCGWYHIILEMHGCSSQFGCIWWDLSDLQSLTYPSPNIPTNFRSDRPGPLGSFFETTKHKVAPTCTNFNHIRGLMRPKHPSFESRLSDSRWDFQHCFCRKWFTIAMLSQKTNVCLASTQPNFTHSPAFHAEKTG